MLKKPIEIIAWISTFQVVSFCVGFLTQANVTTWYSQLNKSILTPPDLVFPIIWTILYTLLALAGWSLWQQRAQTRAKIALVFFFVQMLMNWTWTLLFFHCHWIESSFVWIVVIAALTLVTLLLTRDKFKFSFWMLIPYFLWLLFAAYLNAIIWILN